LKCALGVPLQNVCFCVEKKTQMAAIAGHYFNIRLYGKIKKCFFSETRNLIEPKLNMNNHWMVPYKILFLFCVDWISKMASIARQIKHRTLWGKYFQIIPVSNQWIIWRLECALDGLLQNVCFCGDRKSMMVAIVGHIVLTFDYMGKWKKHVFSETRNLI